MPRTATPRAESVTPPDWAWEKLNSIHKEGQASLADVLVNDGTLKDKNKIVLAIALQKVYEDIADTAVHMLGGKRLNAEIMGTALTGVFLAYTFGSFKWEKTDKGMPLAVPELPDKFLKAEKVLLRNGETHDVKKLIAHIVEHTSGDEIEEMFKHVYHNGFMGSYKKASAQHVIFLMIAVFDICDKHILTSEHSKIEKKAA